MASSLALSLRRATATSTSTAAPSGLVSRLRLNHPIRSASVARSFTTKTEVTPTDERNRSLDVDHRQSSVSSHRDPLPRVLDVFDPFSPTRSISNLLNMVDHFMDIPFQPTSRGMGGGVRRGWDAKEDENALYLRMDMPGIDKEQVKVCVEQNTLVIKGEGEKESEDDENVRRYSSRIDIPPQLYKLDQIKAELKNGVLKIVVPKVKEERKDVLQVKVD